MELAREMCETSSGQMIEEEDGIFAAGGVAEAILAQGVVVAGAITAVWASVPQDS